MTIAAIGLWLLVIALGIQTGAGLFETRVRLAESQRGYVDHEFVGFR